MCGIAGFYDYQGAGRAPSQDELLAMREELSRRGPDEAGLHYAPPVGLAHRRLSIIDLSPTGAQPMSAAGGRVRIVYNGEIYNYPALRAELEAAGHRFRGTSDTEVLLRGYLEWGLDCVHRLNGIFAFGLWDEEQKRLWLCRDHLGIKPLFYSEAGGVIAFASELKSLARWSGLDRAPDVRGLDCFFTYSYIPAPYTRFKGARQLEPGQWLVAEPGGVKLHKYWELPLGVSRPAPRPEMVPEFEALLDAAVKRQMISDVPLGVFLSSGTDSFAVARAMRRGHGGKVTAFSVGFGADSYNELPGAKQAAQALGVDLISEIIQPSPELAQEVADASWEGFADSSSLAVYLLSRFTARHVKVVLGGDGGDELLAGYDTYTLPGLSARLRRLPLPLVRAVYRAARGLPETGRRYSLRQKAWRLAHGAAQGPARDHAAWRIIFTDEDKARLYTPEMRRELAGFDPLELYAGHLRRAAAAGEDLLHAMLYADIAFYLPSDMLVKVDRMSMAHGLEARVPFLDREVVDHAWRLPAEMKLWQGVKKRVLRESIARHFPPELRRAPKQGFNVPPGLVPRPRLDAAQGLGLVQRALPQRLDLYQSWSLFVFSRLGW